MGFFFVDNHGLSENEAELVIKSLNLSSKERDFILGKIDQSGSSKLTKTKIERLYKDLLEDTDDGVSKDKAKQVKDSLLNALKKE